MKIIKHQLNIMQQSGNATRIVLMTSGILILTLVITIIAFIKPDHDDAFNYANEDAIQLTENRNQWSSIEWLEPIELVLDMSRAVFYWQATSELSWKCINKDGFDQGPTGEIVIRNNDCLLYLPANMASIRATQSDLVLVRPLAETQLEITQTTLRVSENSNTYNYDIEAKNSVIGSFESNPEAQLKLTIFAVESEISEY